MQQHDKQIYKAIVKTPNLKAVAQSRRVSSNGRTLFLEKQLVIRACMENFPALWQLLQLPSSDRINLKVILGPLWAYKPGSVKHDGLTGRERTVALINSLPTWSRKEGALTHATRSSPTTPPHRTRVSG